MQGCICPHPPLLVPEVGGAALAEVSDTVAAMRRLDERLGEIDTAVVVSPHTPGYADRHVVRTAPHLRGDFGAFGHPEATYAFDNDLQLAELILALGGGDAEVAVEAVDDDLLDHGVLVPLSYLRVRRVVSLSIVNAYGTHRALGRLMRRCVEECGREAVLVASGDLSHRLTRGAPAGYDPRGTDFDAEIVRLMRIGDFAALASLDRSLVAAVGECGLRSFIALGGFLGDDALKDPQVLSYEGPFGVGYLVAAYGLPGRHPTETA